MKTRLVHILAAILLTSCSSVEGIKKSGKSPELTSQTFAVFKSAERTSDAEAQLIFRKLDDCQYIIFHIGTDKFNSIKDRLITVMDDTFTANPDFVNLKFSIIFYEDTIPDRVTGENITVNRPVNISRYPSDRFLSAGFPDDTLPDDFILELKKNVASDSALDISNKVFYPLKAVIKKKKLIIKNQEAFIRIYGSLFNRHIKNIVLSQPLADIRADKDSIILGEGEISIKKIDEKILITSVKIN